MNLLLDMYLTCVNNLVIYFPACFTIFVIVMCKTEDEIINGIAIKIVQEPASQSYFGNDNVLSNTAEKELKAITKPSNATGPNFLQSLHGSCYSTTVDKYRFDFCPFDNITQHETNRYWNPFKGIIGIWEEWTIENNTFLTMKFSNGDDCGEINRNAYVHFLCGAKNKIINVTEPSKCQYHLTFANPHICNPDNVLVYPHMLLKHQKKWDVLESELSEKLITLEGYEFWLKKLFIEAGFMLAPDKKFLKPKTNVTNEATSQVAIGNTTDQNEIKFHDLNQCNREYIELYNELEELKRKTSIEPNPP